MQDATAAQTQSAPQVSPDPTDQLRGSEFSSSPFSSNFPTMGSTTDNTGGTSTTSASPDGGSGLPISPYSVQPPDSTGEPTSGEPIQGRLQQGGRTPEFTSPIPVPGSTVSGDTSSRAGQLRIPTNNPVQQSGSADLYAFEQQTARHTPTIIPKLLQR